MNTLQKFEKFGHIINVYGTIEKPLFRASEIGKILDLGNVRSSLALIDDKFKIIIIVDTPGGAQKATFLTEPGLYQLIFKSRKKEAVDFQMWIYEEVLPSIRKTGKYDIPGAVYRERLTFKIENEKDLHHKVVNFIRNNYPDALLIAQCGENQDTPQKRIDSKCAGYEAGSPDLIIANFHKHYKGLAIEFKSPTGEGVLTASQKQMLHRYSRTGFKTFISNDYDKILLEIIDYMKNVRYICDYCCNLFKSPKTLSNHCQYIHRFVC